MEEILASPLLMAALATNSSLEVLVGMDDNFESGDQILVDNATISTGAECNSTADPYCGYNFTYPDGAIYMKNPREMLSPWKVNQYFTAIMITYSITTIVGFVGNSFVVSVLHGDRRSASHNRITNVFLISLTIADLVLLLLVSPFETAHYFVLSWDKTGIMCRLAQYLQMLSAASSVWNLTAISLERFIVVVLPMRSKAICTMSNCVKAVLVVWALSTVLTVPALVSKTTSAYTYRNETTSVTIHYCFDNADVGLALSFAVYFFIVVFAFPAIVMIICYAIVIKHLWLSSRNMSQLINAKSLRRPAEKARTSRMAASSSKTSLLAARFRDRRRHQQQFPQRGTTRASLTMEEIGTDGNQDLQVMHPSASASTVISTAVITNSRSADDGHTAEGFHDLHGRGQGVNNKTHTGQASMMSSQTETSLLSSGVDIVGCTGNGGGGALLAPAGSSSMRDINGKSDSSSAASSNMNNNVVPKTSGKLKRLFRAKSRTNSGNGGRGNLKLQVPLMTGNRNHHHPHRHSLISNGNTLVQRNATSRRCTASGITTNSGCKNNGADVRKSRNQVIKMLILIVVIFCVCWGPKLIWDILAKLDLYEYSPEIYTTKVTINLFPFVHACCNPIIYAFMSRNFRQAVKRRYPRFAEFCRVLLHCGRRLYRRQDPDDPDALGTSMQLPTPSTQVSRRTTIVQHQESML